MQKMCSRNRWWGPLSTFTRLNVERVFQRGLPGLQSTPPLCYCEREKDPWKWGPSAALTRFLNLRSGNSEIIETIRNSTTHGSRGQACSVEQCCDSSPNRGGFLNCNRRASYRAKRLHNPWVFRSRRSSQGFCAQGSHWGRSCKPRLRATTLTPDPTPLWVRDDRETTPAGSEFSLDEQASLSLRRLDSVAEVVISVLLPLSSTVLIFPQALAAEEFAGFRLVLCKYSKIEPMAVLTFGYRKNWYKFR